MAIDTSNERAAHEATGWERGLYDDIKTTFRAPVVNWIWRTLIANEPRATRYIWGQVKSLFETQACLEYVREHRRTIREAVETPNLDPSQLSMQPAEYRELQGQLRTFDAVVPRLSLLFEVADRCLGGEGLTPSTSPNPSATMPHSLTHVPEVRRPPTMASVPTAEERLPETIHAIRTFHGLNDGLPSVYRCLVQWPNPAATMWEQVAPVLRSQDFRESTDRTLELVDTVLDETAYVPQLAPDDFKAIGCSRETVEDLQALFAEFNRGAIETVLPAVHVYAEAVGIEPTGD